MSVVGKVLNRIILLCLQGAVGATLRDQQAGFKKGHPCIDQIATLRIIIEQTIEWNTCTSLYINFVDFEKAFDSLDISVLWCLMRHYGITGKFIQIIKNSYDKMTCEVLHAGGLSENFMGNTGFKQGCLMAPFLFLLTIDWIMIMKIVYLGSVVSIDGGSNEDINVRINKARVAFKVWPSHLISRSIKFRIFYISVNAILYGSDNVCMYVNLAGQLRE